jgi:hypothetical protein
VIAETTDLPTRYTKSVVTDDQGRYVIPDLPLGNYQVWVRGYGLVDSAKMRAKPGQILNHTAIKAPDERAAAHYYPALYWYTMMKIPPAADFGGHTDIPKGITRDTWIQRMNNTDCIAGQAGEMMTNRRRSAWRRALQILRRLDRPRGEGRIAQAQAAAALGHRAQRGGHHVGLVELDQMSGGPRAPQHAVGADVAAAHTHGFLRKREEFAELRLRIEAQKARRPAEGTGRVPDRAPGRTMRYFDGTVY